MENVIIIAIIAFIVLLSARYVYKAKKNGKKCIGCPNNGCGGCCCSSDNKD